MRYLSLPILLGIVAPSLVVLTGCLDPEKSRPYDEFVSEYYAIVDAGRTADAIVADLGDDPDGSNPVDLGPPDMGPAPIDFGTNPPIDTCSQMGGDPVTVSFMNATGIDGDLYWVDFDCAEQQYNSISAGTQGVQGTFVGHVWRLYTREGHHFLAEAVVSSITDTYIVLERQ